MEAKLLQQPGFLPLLITQRTCPGLHVSADLTLMSFDPRPTRGGLWCHCQSKRAFAQHSTFLSTAAKDRRKQQRGSAPVSPWYPRGKRSPQQSSTQHRSTRQVGAGLRNSRTRTGGKQAPAVVNPPPHSSTRPVEAGPSLKRGATPSLRDISGVKSSSAQPYSTVVMAV
ncbi:hypothetical protein NQZ68_013068 [Dissostichus eleginoides]|nr:hypothetical protein NQZ68_013068 [Dissostichus eleginoides]